MGTVLAEQLKKGIPTLAFFALPIWCWYREHPGNARTIWQWLGLYWPRRPNWWAMLKLLAVAALVSQVGLLAVMLSGYSARGREFSLDGVTVPLFLFYLLLYGLRSGLVEEILFRGFLSKRLIGWLGFQRGNLLQAAIFGLLHYSLMTTGSPLSPADRLLRVANAALLGYVFGYITEKQAEGSILPAAFAHAAFNIFPNIILTAILVPVFF